MNMNKTNYLIALSVALFWACSDSPNEAGTTEIDNTMALNDSSSSAEPDNGNLSSSAGDKQSSSSGPQSSSGGKEKPSKAFAADTKNGFKLGSCITSLARRTFLAADIAASEELPEAYLLNDGEGHYQVMLLNVNDYCSVIGSAKTTRSGDTLEIGYGDNNNVTECMCNSDHWFDIEAVNRDVEYVRFSGKTYEVSDKPAPEPSATQNDSTAAQNDTTSTQNDSTATQADSTAAQDSSTFTDPRDGKTYRTVKLGERIWMAENLNYEIKDSLVSNCDENGGCDMGFPTNRPQSWCNGNKQENCDKYGRLYNFEAAKVACPSGWSLPTVEEWPERGNGGYPAFVDYAVVEWGGGKDTYGFTVLPAGEYKASSQSFLEPGRFAFFWTSTIDNLNHDCPTMIHFGNGSEGMVSVCADDENDGHSVRCVKD
jgi:uncharacterized protein (TIGR02145 family)